MDFSHDATAWVALSFGIFLSLVWFKGRKSILGFLDSKVRVIREEVEGPQNLRLEAQRLFQEYEMRHQEALKDAEQIVRNAEKQAIEMRRQAELDLADMVRVREKQLEERIERMKQAATEEIRNFASELALKATASIIKEKLDKPVHERLVSQSIAGLSKSLN